jgi:hypothetical protein
MGEAATEGAARTIVSTDFGTVCIGGTRALVDVFINWTCILHLTSSMGVLHTTSAIIYAVRNAITTNSIKLVAKPAPAAAKPNCGIVSWGEE